MIPTQSAAVDRATEGFTDRMLSGMREARTAVLRYWNVVRPGWPVPALSILSCLLLFGSTQGREALHVVGRPENVQFGWTFVILVVTSIAQYGVFLIAVCGYYKSFSDRAFPGAGVRLVSAAMVGLTVPTLVFGFFLLTEGFHGVDLGEPSAAVVALIVLIMLGLAGLWYSRRRVRLQLSPFSAIVRVSPAFTAVLGTLCILSAILLVMAAFDIDRAREIGPVGLTLLATTLWSVFWTGAAALVERSGLPPTPVIALVLAVLVSLVGPWATEHAQEVVRFDRNQVDTMQGDPDTDRLVAADTYAREWLEERAQGPAATGPVRAIVVIAEGGGIRAALQTAALLEELDRRGLYCDLYVLSGVSGGSVGIANYLADRGRADGGGEPCAGRSLDAVSSLKEDHLSPLLANMYAWDWPMAFVPAPTEILGAGYELHDRARAFESSLGHDDDAGLMSRSFLDVVQTARQGDRARGPIVLLNTTRTADGAGEVVSNVTFLRSMEGAASPPAAADPDLADVASSDQRDTERLCNVLERLPDGDTLSMATAAHLSARFPFVSPPGALRTNAGCGSGSGDVLLRYVDGGYLDNSGALSASQAVAELERVRGNVQIQYVVIHVYTQSIGSKSLRSNELLPEVTGPIDAVVGARNLQGLGPIISLCRQVQSLSGGGDDAVCDRRARQRVVDPCGAESCFPSIRDDYTLRAQEGAPPYWISAPLWASSNATEGAFVPLGWVLGERSADYVDGQMRSVGRQIADVLAHAAPSTPQ